MAKKQIEQTEIEAPYELPEGWKWCKLGDVCKFENGYAFKADKFSKTGIPVIRITNIKENEIDLSDCIHSGETNIDDKFLVRKGDLLIAMSGATTGKNGVYLSEEKVYLNQRVGNIKVIDNKILNDKFRNFYIQEKEQEILRNAYGGAQPNISSNKICEMLFPLPPTLEEQQRIVNRIETLFAKLDQAKEKAQNVVDTFETRKASILHKAFTGELTKKWRKGNGVGDDSWEEKKLEEISLKIGDGLHGTPIYAENGKFAFINGNNFSNDHIEIKSDTKYVDEDEYKKHFIELFVDKTVFVSINGTLGKTAFFNDEKVILGKSACYINVKNEFLSKHFLKIYFETKEFIDYANEKATGSTIKNLGLRAMRDLKINLPTLPEQTEIVRILDVILEKETKAKEAAETVLEQIDLLKKSILARAFRGEI
ncbi:MAG: restriction endonuclease subunit S [Treponema sp.]|nr:restriction endonuclease subunit S [Treponema sp.]